MRIFANALLFLMLTVGIASGGNTIVQKTYGNQSPVISGSNDVIIKYGSDSNSKNLFDDTAEMKMTGTKRVYDLSNVYAPGCSVKEIYEALKDLSDTVSLSTGLESMTLEYRTPASQLRRHAEEMERRDATILKAREVLKRCGKYFEK